MAACASGVAVPDPAGNPGLVRDCAVLLDALGALLGAGDTADWSADRPIRDWSGVGVDGSPPRVTSLASSGPTFSGRLPPVLGALSHLRYLGLYNNQLTGELPPELGSLSRLGLVELFGNELTGAIPPELGRLSNLGGLWLSGNRLAGTIPPELGRLSNLRDLDLGWNELTGGIPAELGQLSRLQFLSLAGNRLTGEIPPELGQLSRLERLQLGGGENAFGGAFPAALADLPNLRSLALDADAMTGCIPPGLQRFAARWSLPFCRDAADAPAQTPPDPQLLSACAGGAVPEPQENPGLVADCAILLEAAETLARDPDRLGWSARRPIADWSGIRVEGSPARVTAIRLPPVALGGRIPPGLARLSHLQELSLSGSELAGEIPPELGQLWNLRTLFLHDNALTGEIPGELAELPFLATLYLRENRLTGGIPPELGSAASLQSLVLAGNDLTGEIPASLAALPDLELLDLHGNRLGGDIPRELSSLRSLRSLDLRDNELSGGIPDEFTRGRIRGLSLWLSGNRLTGCLPLGAAETVGDYRDLGLPYCECPSPPSGGAAPSLTVGADGVPFMPHEPTDVPGTYRITFALVLDLPEGGRFSLDSNERTDSGEIVVRIWEERSRSALVIDPFTGEERSRVVLEGPPDCAVSVSELFDAVVASAREQPLAVPGEGDGIPALYLLQPQDGGRTYRVGGSRFVFDAPAGMRVTFEGSRFICLNPGGCYSTLALRDEASGSRLTLDAADGQELWRWVAPEGAGRDVGALFDRLAASIRDEPPPEPSCALGAAAPDCALLLEIRDLLAPDGVLNWSDEVPLVSWSGVGVDRRTGRVVALRLAGQGLSGGIPGALGGLSGLEVLDLSFNSLTGPIPPELGQLSALRGLNLSFNSLTGSIPAELGRLSELRTLDLSYTRLSGTFPPALLALSRLEQLTAQVAGGVPPELGSLSHLRKLDLRGVTGVIPPELGRLPELRELRLSGSLTGVIPPELGSLPQLEELTLTGALTGGIPPELGSLRNLRRLSLDGNPLAGGIPPELGSLWNLETLGLRDTLLTGRIPVELGELWYLQFVWLRGNQLTGEIPPGWGGLSELLNMDLTGNRLEGCIPAGLQRFVQSTPESNPGLRRCAPAE